MEPTKQILNHIFCPIHEDIIRKVGISGSNDLSLLALNASKDKNYKHSVLKIFWNTLHTTPHLFLNYSSFLVLPTKFSTHKARW